jgi:broad specificity phosphatase PhoE
VLDGLRATAAAHQGQRVAVVTHAGVVSQVLGVLRGRTASVWALDRPDPLTATEIIWHDDGLRGLVAFNVQNWY